MKISLPNSSKTAQKISINNSSMNTSTPENLAFIVFIQNVTSQLLNTLLHKTDHPNANKKSERFTYSHKLFRRWNTSKSFVSPDFRKKADNLVDERNAFVHPSRQLLDEYSTAAIHLIEKYHLHEVCAFELKTLKTFQRKRTHTKKREARKKMSDGISFINRIN